MNQHSMFFGQTSTLTTRMSLKLTKHGKFRMENNQLPTNAPVELKVKSLLYTLNSALLIFYGRLYSTHCVTMT